MKTLVITLLASIALGRSQQRSSEEPQAASYVDYDSGWTYEPKASTYIEYESDWKYEPPKSNYASSYNSYSGYNSGYVYSPPPRQEHHHHYDHNSNVHHSSISIEDFFGGVVMLSIAGIVGVGCCAVGNMINKKQEKERKEREKERLERGQAFALEVREVDINNIDAANDGNFVFLKGSLTIDGPPSDPKFSMPTQNEAWIKRRVEVYCWKEELSNFEERRGDQVRRGTKCDYKPVWVEVNSMPDSNRFRDKSKVNIKSNVHNEEFGAYGARLGSFQIDMDHVMKLGKRVKFTKMFEWDGQFRAPPDRDGIWTFDQRNQVLRRQKVEGSNQIGDLSITYECIEGFGPRGGLNVVALGKQSPAGGNIVKLHQSNKVVSTLLDFGHMSKETFIQKHGR